MANTKKTVKKTVKKTITSKNLKDALKNIPHSKVIQTYRGGKLVETQTVIIGNAGHVKKAVNEQVNHPSHYGGADNQYEAIKVIRAWGMDKNFCLGNTLKYISRAGKKDPKKTLEDLKKAAWYLQDEINELEKKGR